MGVLDYKLSFAISPIYLTGGIAGNLVGGTLPIISLLQGNNFDTLLSSANDVNLDDYFATFQPIPGTSIVANAVGTYPFANQQVAANAIITQPLSVSLIMICPARNAGDYALKFTVMSALKNSLNQHNLAGGTYTVATPTGMFTDCLLTRLSDVSGGETKQVEWRWQWDFTQPLISLQAAQGAYNNLTSKMTSGVQVTPNANGEVTPSNTDSSVGNSTSPTTVPAGSSNKSGITVGFPNVEGGVTSGPLSPSEGGGTDPLGGLPSP